MITLNTEKELVKIDSWQDVLDRPDYVSNIDPKTIQLEAIIGSYVLPHEVPCGLATCHQPHKNGYLVSTKGKEVTNIGNVCGKNNFSVDFQTLRNKFNRDIRIKSQKESLTAFKRQIPEYEQRVLDLRQDEFGADWAYRHITSLKLPNRGVPEKLRTALSRMLRAGRADIYKDRQATEKEVSMLEAAQGKRLSRPHYVEEKIGYLEGLMALAEEYDLRKILIEDIERGIDRITEMNIENATEHQLSLESKWAGELEGKLEKASESQDLARRLLTKANLSQLLPLLEDATDLKQFKAFLNSLP